MEKELWFCLFKSLEGTWPGPSEMKKAKTHRGYNYSKRKYGRLRINVPVTVRNNCKP